jgi:hypothetical protein
VPKRRPPPTPTELSLRGSAGGHAGWAKTTDRAERMSKAWEKSPQHLPYWQRWVDEVLDPDHLMSERDRAKSAVNAHKAHMKSLAFKSMKARRLRKEARAAERTKNTNGAA